MHAPSDDTLVRRQQRLREDLHTRRGDRATAHHALRQASGSEEPRCQAFGATGAGARSGRPLPLGQLAGTVSSKVVPACR